MTSASALPVAGPNLVERRLRQRSIKTLLALLVIACLLPGVLGAAFLFYEVYQSGRSELEKEATQTARALVQAIDFQILKIEYLAQGLATSKALARGDLPTFHKRARKAMNELGLSEGVTIIDRSGQIVLQSRVDYGTALPLNGNPQMVDRVFKTRQAVVSDLFVSAMTRDFTMVVAVPVIVSGEVKYVLSIPIRPEHFRVIIEAQDLPRDRIASILDSTGTIAARSRSEKEFVGQKGTPTFVQHYLSAHEGIFEAPTKDHIPSFVVFARSPVTGWGVGIAISLDDLEAHWKPSIAKLAVGVTLLFALGLSLAWIIGQRIANSFRMLQEPAVALGAGRRVSLPPIDVKEAADLAGALVEADKLLRRRSDALDASLQTLQDSERRYKSLFNNKTNAITHLRIVTDEQGKPIDYYIDDANEACELITDVKNRDVVGKRVTEAFPGIEHSEFDSIREYGKIGLEGGEATFESYFPPTGQWLSLYAFSPNKGEVTVIFSDITAQKTAEETIRQLNADLEKRVEARTAELMAANRELENITFATSHDLRGPLGRINSFSSLLEQQYRERLEGNGLVFLQFIRQNAIRLAKLVDDLVAHAGVAQQPLALKSVDVARLVENVLLEKEGEILEAHAKISTHLQPACVMAEVQTLSQVVRNLLDNALKFSRDSAAPVITISGWHVNGRYALSVRDNGIGFDMAYKDKIFEMFQRLHTYEKYAGSGVGLALVKRAVERMGGRVWAEGEPGRGAEFFVELMLAPTD